MRKPLQQEPFAIKKFWCSENRQGVEMICKMDKVRNKTVAAAAVVDSN